MPYVWLCLVLYFGLHDEVFIICVASLCYAVVMWIVSELRAAAENAEAFDVRIMWHLIEDLTEVKP